jgi:metal-responsive CopG/Arc/MetJ family transcriptional regulator
MTTRFADTDKEMISILLPRSVLKKVDQLAAAEDRSRSGFIRWLVLNAAQASRKATATQ